jgi:hypothetical protein
LILKKPGKKSNTSRIAVALLAAAAVTTLSTVDLYGGDSFLLPGVVFSDAEFTVGSWCRYLVVDELLGEQDSTIVYMAVTGQTETPEGEFFWFEIKTGPTHALPREQEVVKALISYKIKGLTPGDSLCHYVSRLYIRKGTGPVEQADPADLERLTSSNPTSDSDWKLTPGVNTDVPGGRFVCAYKTRTVLDRRDIPMGRTTLVKNDTDRYEVWFSDDIPIFRLAKCVIERVRDSKTVPAIPGIPDKGREVTRSTVELTAFGRDAESILNVK